MERSKVSIIVPVFNIEKYIHRCVNSILAQTFTDFECILVDDYSSDNSSKICDEYAKQDYRIKTIHKSQNEGASFAKKTGFEYSSGAYIQFVDGDDWIEPDMVEKMYSMAISNNYDLVYCNWFRHDKLNQILYEMPPELSNDYIMNIKAMSFGWGCVVWNKLAKREIYEQIIFPKYSCCEDTYMTTQLLFFSQNTGHVNKALYHYMYNPTSLINHPKLNQKRYSEAQSNFIATLNFLKEKFDGNITAFEPELTITMDKRLNIRTILKIKIKKALKSILPYGIVMSHEISKVKSTLLKSQSECYSTNKNGKS